MVEEGEGQVHNVNGEQPSIGWGRRGNRGGGRGGERDRCSGIWDPKPFGFPINDEDTTYTMKNISPTILPKFHGIRSEDPETFLFEFELLWRSYDYLHDAQKLKLFPATLKGSALKWFMSLGTNCIGTCEKMKYELLEKSKDYGMPHGIKMYFLRWQKGKMKILNTLSKYLFIILKRKNE